MIENGDQNMKTSILDKQFWDYFDPPHTTNKTLLHQNGIDNTNSFVMNSETIDDGSILILNSEASFGNDFTFNFSTLLDLNTTFPDDVPTHPRSQWLVLAVYGVLMVVGGVGNVVVLAALARTRRRRSRIALLMTHLAVADVCVTCGVIPLEIGWKYTNAWLAGNYLCKSLVVLRAFGLYLSSNVLVCISLDRFFAVVYPLRVTDARRRNKQMLWGAWITALACSLPQSVVFRVMRHPRVAGFEQCVTFSAFSSPSQEVAYNVFCVCAMYLAPLAVIAVCYTAILTAVRRSPATGNGHCEGSSVTSSGVWRGSGRTLARARRRTLRMTVTIVAVFALCWLPYATMALWYMIDRASASRVSPQVQDLLFAMAVSNSCMNPLVYGSYALRCTGCIRRGWREACCCTHYTSGNPGVDSAKDKHLINMEMNTALNTPSQGRGMRVRFAETTALSPRAAARAPA